MEFITKRKRTSRGRSKQGCQQCRFRHIKCDETWPECQNCNKAKIVCSGQPKKSIPTSILGCISVQPNRGRTESETFHYYATNLAPRIIGEVDQDFWIQSVCPAARDEDAIYDAILGATSLWNVPREQISIPDRDKAPDPIRKRYQLAIQWYSKSIQACTKSRQDVNTKQSILTILISSILHSITEIRLGHLRNAAGVVKVAYSVINSYKALIAETPNKMMLAVLAQLLALTVTFAIDASEIPKDHINCTMIIAIYINTRLGVIEHYQSYLETTNALLRFSEILSGQIPVDGSEGDKILSSYMAEPAHGGMFMYTVMRIQWHVFKYGFHTQRKSLEFRLSQLLNLMRMIAAEASQDPWAKLPWALDLYLAPLALIVCSFWRETETLDTITSTLSAFRHRSLLDRLLAYCKDLVETPYGEATRLEKKIFGTPPRVLSYAQVCIVVTHVIEGTGVDQDDGSRLDHESPKLGTDNIDDPGTVEADSYPLRTKLLEEPVLEPVLDIDKAAEFQETKDP